MTSWPDPDLKQAVLTIFPDFFCCLFFLYSITREIIKGKHEKGWRGFRQSDMRKTNGNNFFWKCYTFDFKTMRRTLISIWNSSTVKNIVSVYTKEEFTDIKTATQTIYTKWEKLLNVGLIWLTFNITESMKLGGFSCGVAFDGLGPILVFYSLLSADGLLVIYRRNVPQYFCCH